MSDNTKTVMLTTVSILAAFALVAIARWGWKRYGKKALPGPKPPQQQAQQNATEVDANVEQQA